MWLDFDGCRPVERNEVHHMLREKGRLYGGTDRKQQSDDADVERGAGKGAAAV
jgi:hypothetical protein